MQNEIIFTRPAHYIGQLTGIVTVPTDFDASKESLPVILFLHGAGERGNGTEETVDRVKVHGIPKYFSKDPDFGGLRVITVSPQCPKDFIWDQLTFQLKEYIDAAVGQFNGDRSKISITGLSMGGFGTWNMLTTYPDYFYKAAPVCAGGVAWRADGRLKGKSIHAFHSLDDGAVDYEYGVLVAKHAAIAGADVEFTTYSSEGHGCWDRAYEESDVIGWLVK